MRQPGYKGNILLRIYLNSRMLFTVKLGSKPSTYNSKSFIMSLIEWKKIFMLFVSCWKTKPMRKRPTHCFNSWSTLTVNRHLHHRGVLISPKAGMWIHVAHRKSAQRPSVYKGWAHRKVPVSKTSQDIKKHKVFITAWLVQVLTCPRPTIQMLWTTARTWRGEKFW